MDATPSSNATLTVVSLTAPGVTLSTLYSFTGGLDGGNPNGLMQDTNGNFYGTTQDGGTQNSGTVFQMTPAGTVTTLDWFNDMATRDTCLPPRWCRARTAIYTARHENGGTERMGDSFQNNNQRRPDPIG